MFLFGGRDEKDVEVPNPILPTWYSTRIKKKREAVETKRDSKYHGYKTRLLYWTAHQLSFQAKVVAKCLK